jgi:uracil-DNA glycosylase
MKQDSLQDIVRDLENYLGLEKESGIDELMSRPAPRREILHKASEIPQGVSLKTQSRFYTAKDKKSALEELETHVQECSQCGLCHSRRNPVFGQGNPDARLMFIGEAPGLQEDIQAQPFVGKAGILLTKIIEAIGFTRADVYIANCLKCRPPQNRNPLPSEVLACREFFIKQIEIIEPKVICCLGRFAAQTVLMSEETISRLRGGFHDIDGIKVMPTFHPAYLLRNPQDKRLVWQDMKKVRDYLKDCK